MVMVIIIIVIYFVLSYSLELQVVSGGGIWRKLRLTHSVSGRLSSPSCRKLLHMLNYFCFISHLNFQVRANFGSLESYLAARHILVFRDIKHISL